MRRIGRNEPEFKGVRINQNVRSKYIKFEPYMA